MDLLPNLLIGRRAIADEITFLCWYFATLYKPYRWR